MRKSNATKSGLQRMITIDGPAGSGKSTAARRLAQALDFIYLNTGAMYRAVAHVALEDGLEIDDARKATQIARAARQMRFEYKPNKGRQHFIVNGRDCTEALFTAALTGRLKPVVNNTAVRMALVAKMRQAAKKLLTQGIQGVVMEGRDIGTVVFPCAPLKFYIHASIEERTRRRVAELRARGEVVDFAGIRKQIKYRDETDRGRRVGRLMKAADAADINTTGRDEEHTLKLLLKEVRKRAPEFLPS